MALRIRKITPGRLVGGRFVASKKNAGRYSFRKHKKFMTKAGLVAELQLRRESRGKKVKRKPKLLNNVMTWGGGRKRRSRR